MADLAAGSADYLPRKRPSTQRVYRQQIAADILPALGAEGRGGDAMPISKPFIARLSARAPTHANRMLAVLSKMFSLAVRWGMRADNPCRGIERNQEHKRNRYLSGAELARLSTALAELPDQGAANAVRLLLLTGARRGELLAAKWGDFDLEAGVWIKPGATTKQRTEHRVPLSAAGAARCWPRCARRLATRRNGCSPLAAAAIASKSTTAWDELRKAAEDSRCAGARPAPHLRQHAWHRRANRCPSSARCSGIRPR